MTRPDRHITIAVLAPGKPKAILLGGLLALLATGVAIGAVLARTSDPRPAARVAVTVERATVGRPIPASFLGLSLEYPNLESYAGSDSRALDPTLVRLIRGLAPYGSPSIRFGGDTTDWTWWPVRGMSRPNGIRYSLTPRWLAVAKALATATGARLLLGVNLEADSRRIADAEVRQFTRAFGRQSITGFEIGNEPELYGSFAWYVLNHVPHYGRPAGYSFRDFMSDFAQIARTMPHAPLAGPDIGGPAWMPYLGRFLSVERRVSLATLHRYPLKRCRASTHRTIGELLANSSSTGLANGLARFARTAHAHHVPLRIDEMNAVSCGGEADVSDTFAAALWSVDALFSLARVGIDGVNIHTRPRTPGELFTITHVHGNWRARIHPEYYGLMLFAQAAPPGARLLKVAGGDGKTVRIWATTAASVVRVVLINKSTHDRRTIVLRVPAARMSTGSLERLEARSAHSTRGAKLTSAGPISARNGSYVIALPAASAALLTLQ